MIDGTATTVFDTSRLPQSRTYSSFQVAQASLGILLYRLGATPAGAASGSIQAEASASSDFCSITAHQIYRLPADAWLELTQLYANPPYENGVWGQAHWDAEAQGLSVAGQPAYLIERFGWWTLDWKIGDDGFELRAPIESMSSAELVGLAETVRR